MPCGSCLCVCVCVCVFYLAKDYRRMNFSETSTVYMSCIRTWSFNSRLISHFVWILEELDHLFWLIIKQVHNSLTVNDNSWTLKFDNFSEFQNVISDSQMSVIMTHCVQKSIWLNPYHKKQRISDWRKLVSSFLQTIWMSASAA